MELEYLGGNCIKLTTKKATLVVDDSDLSKLGAKQLPKTPAISLYTTANETKSQAEFVFDAPGEYEVHDISIQGIAARSFGSEPEAKNNTIYRLVVDDTRVVIAGNIVPDLSDDQLEAIGTVDILFVPVGGGGAVLDGVGALKLIKKIEPKLIVPTYYADKGLKYNPMPVELSLALKELSMEPAETVESLKIKGREVAENTQLIVIKRQ